MESNAVGVNRILKKLVYVYPSTDVHRVASREGDFLRIPSWEG
jgi:hypothetical protein